MNPDLEDDENNVQPLSEDNTSPFSPPTDPINDVTDGTDREANATIDPTHQATDSNIEMEEVYDEGLSGAAEAMEPNAGSAVTGYTPPANNLNSSSENSGDSEDVSTLHHE